MKTIVLSTFAILMFAVSTLALEVSAPFTTQPANSKFAIPISVDNATGIVGYQFHLLYDPAVITPDGDNAGCSLEGTIAATNYWVTCNVDIPGRLRMMAYGIQPLFGGGPVLHVTFASFEGKTSLEFAQAYFSEGVGPVRTSTVAGQILLE